MAITANTGGIQAFGPGGDDTSFLDESKGALPRPAVRRRGLRRADRRLGQRPALRPLLRGLSQWLIEKCTPFFTYTTPRIGWAGDSTRLVATRKSLAE